MSNPLFSLRKAKKAPLIMPELANQHIAAESPSPVVPEFSSDLTQPSQILSPFQQTRRSSIDQRNNEVFTPSMSNGFLSSTPGPSMFTYKKKATYLTPIHKSSSK